MFGGAALLGLVEWLRGHLFTGFPWAAPGLAVDGMGGLAQLAAVIGMPGLTVLIVLWAGLPYGVFDPASRFRRAAAMVLLVSLPMAWAAGSYRLAGADGSTVPGVALRIVQPNISQEAKWRQENARAIFEDLKTLSASASAAHPDGIGSITHVIWPESAVPFAIDESPAAKAELSPLLGGRSVLITGSLRRETVSETDIRVFNSIIVFDGRAEPVARYDKWRLVPGGEFLPFEWLLEPLGFRKVVTVPGSFASGPGPVTLSVPGAPDAGFLVCYEAIFPHDLVDREHRPGFLVNVTNDGWFGHSTGPYQHLAQARLRAIEQGLPLVRAANTGISAVIDAYGRELKTLPLMERGVLDSALPAALPPTLYAQAGDWTGGAIMLVFMVLALALRSGRVVSPVSRN